MQTLVRSLQKKTYKKNVGNIYVETTIHKAKIELSEEGTKGAAETEFRLDVTSSVQTKKKKTYILHSINHLYISLETKNQKKSFSQEQYINQIMEKKYLRK